MATTICFTSMTRELKKNWNLTLHSSASIIVMLTFAWCALLCLSLLARREWNNCFRRLCIGGITNGRRSDGLFYWSFGEAFYWKISRWFWGPSFWESFSLLPPSSLFRGMVDEPVWVLVAPMTSSGRRLTRLICNRRRKKSSIQSIFSYFRLA